MDSTARNVHVHKRTWTLPRAREGKKGGKKFTITSLSIPIKLLDPFIIIYFNFLQ